MSCTLEETRTEPPVEKTPYKKRWKLCIVCDQESVGVANYLFQANGRNKIGLPFCKLHLDHQEVFATPVFENVDALNLFRKEHSALFQRCAHGKIILFLQQPKTNVVSVA